MQTWRVETGVKFAVLVLMLFASVKGRCDGTMKPGLFADDVAFLKQHTDVIVLADPDSGARVAVIPGMQARIMTSSAEGDQGQSFGWVNYEAVAKKERQPHINVYGGEDRFWMGPEGGQYSIFFKKGDPFDLEHWQTPEPIDWGPWDVVKKDETMAEFRKSFSLTNFSGTALDLQAERTVRLLSRKNIGKLLDCKLADAVKAVGVESDNRVTNTGKNPWTKEGGLPSIWILGMFRHSPATTVVIPFKAGPEAELGKIVNDAYFGKVPADRLKVDEKNGILYFKGDGQCRSKIGIPPARAKDVAGSYDAEKGVLTVVKFNLPAKPRDYVNSMWEIQKEPYGGDVVNSYNDGPPAPGPVQCGQGSARTAGARCPSARSAAGLQRR